MNRTKSAALRVFTVLIFAGAATGALHAQENDLPPSAPESAPKHLSENLGGANGTVQPAASDDAVAYNETGTKYLAAAQYDKAVGAFEKAVALDDQSPKIFFNLGTAYSLNDQKAEAITALQKAVALDPQYIKARSRLCAAHFAAEQNDDAVGCYKKLLPAAQQDDTVYLNYGTALILTGHPKEAAEVLEETTRRFSPQAETFGNLGVAFFKLDRRKDAIKAFNRALELAADNDGIRFNLAIAQLAEKNRTAALEQYAYLKNTNVELARRLYDMIYSDRIVVVKDK